MVEDVVVEPMTEEFIVWRCLHGGPLSCKTIDTGLRSWLHTKDFVGRTVGLDDEDVSAVEKRSECSVGQDEEDIRILEGYEVAQRAHRDADLL